MFLLQFHSRLWPGYGRARAIILKGRKSIHRRKLLVFNVSGRESRSYSPFKGHSVQWCSLVEGGETVARFRGLRADEINSLLPLARLLKREWVVASTTSLESLFTT